MSRRLFTIIAGLIAVMFTLALFPLRAYALPPSSDTVYPGIDVSKWQGSIDFDRVKADGINIVYIRAGAGNDYKDPYFERNYNNAKAAGLDIGFYHSMTARSVSEAKQQAKFFVSLLAGKTADCMIAMDFGAGGQLPVSTANDTAIAFMREVERLSGKDVMIYTSTNGAKTRWSSALASEFPLWVAQYGPSTPSDNGQWDSWVGFQYSNTGRIDGISGDVDLDKFTQDVYLADNSPIPGNEPGPIPEDIKLIRITVARGDTLSRLASKYGTTVSSLVRLNEIENPNLIYIGEQLYVLVDASFNAPCYDTYQIKRGDTLSRIAYRFSTTVQRLAAINRIDNPDLIYAGQTIDIGYCRHEK